MKKLLLVLFLSLILVSSVGALDVFRGTFTTVGDIITTDGSIGVATSTIPSPYKLSVAGAMLVTGETKLATTTIDTDTFYVDSINNRVGIGTTTPHSAFHIGGSFAQAATSTNYSLTAGATHTILMDATSAIVTTTLPTAVGIRGREYVITKTDTSTNIVVILPNGSETIDGLASAALVIAREKIKVVSDGNNWISDQVGKWRPIYYSNTNIDFTASTTSATPIATTTLPSHTLGANGGVRVLVSWNGASDDAQWMSIHFGGTQTHRTSTANYASSLHYIFNRNATNSQIASQQAVIGGLGGSGDAFIVPAIDTTKAVSIVLKGQKTDGSETMSIRSVLIEAIKLP